MKTISNREAEARFQWLEDQWNQPNRTDYYLMQAAMEAFFSHRKRPKNPDVGAWKLPFSWKEQGKTRPKDKLTAAAWAKAKWFAIAGVTKEIIKRGLGLKNPPSE